MSIFNGYSPQASLTSSSGDVGGQKTLRPYWRNYFEQTDAIVWVVDSVDRMRTNDCKIELHSLLLEDVSRSSRIISSLAEHFVEARGCIALDPGQ